MNYYVREIELKEARYFPKKYKFDYIEPDSFEKIKELYSFSVIGYMTLSRVEKEDTMDKVVISNGLKDYYFKFKPFQKGKSIKPKKVIGYVMVKKDTYIAIYKRSKIIPILLCLLLSSLLISRFFL